MLNKFLESNCFVDDPFASTNADKEPRLATYFVPPPYFTSVRGEPRNPKSNVVLAPRGGGKTAQKVMIEESALQEQSELAFCISYDSFRTVSRAKITTANIDWHLEQVVQRLLSGVLTLIEGGHGANLTKSDKRVLAFAFRRHLGTLSAADAERIFSSVKSVPDKVKSFLSEHGRNIAKLVGALPTIWGLEPLELELAQKELRDEPAIYLVEKLVGIIKSFGYDSVYILVDRVDEIPEFANNAELCFRFIEPLLSDLSLLELDGLAFKFFLWDQIEDHLDRSGFRADRVTKFHLNWTLANLEEMLSRRLSAYSNGKITSLNQLLADSVSIDVHRLACMISGGSPRDVIRVVSRIIDEHIKLGDDSGLIEKRSIDAAIRSYSRERSNELYGDKVADLTKINKTSFTIGELANDIFRISHQAARNKIQNLLNVGAVIKSGEIENPGNRPLHQYSVVDPRLAVVMISEFKAEDVFRFYCFVCPRCHTVLVREGSDCACHECSLEFPLEDKYSLLNQCTRH